MTCPCGATLTADSVEALAKEIQAHTKRVHNTDTSDSEALEMARQAAAGK
jgi:predicted small metal-binding protein